MSYQDKAREILKSKGFINDFAVDELTQLFKEEVEQIIGQDNVVTGHQRPQGYISIDLTESYRNDLRADQRARLNKTIEEK